MLDFWFLWGSKGRVLDSDLVGVIQELDHHSLGEEVGDLSTCCGKLSLGRTVSKMRPGSSTHNFALAKTTHLATCSGLSPALDLVL